MTTEAKARIRFVRTDTDGASEILTLVRLTSELGRAFASTELAGAYPYLVEVCTGPDVGDDFVGLYDLDGDRVELENAEWEAVPDAPEEVIEQVERGWETGTTTVERFVAEAK